MRCVVLALTLTASAVGCATVRTVCDKVARVDDKIGEVMEAASVTGVPRESKLGDAISELDDMSGDLYGVCYE